MNHETVKDSLVMSVSGIRGIVGSSLTPQVLTNVISAYAKWLRTTTKRRTVYIGRDTRSSGDAITRLVSSTLNMCGYITIDIGIAPTPTVQLVVEKKRAAGGVVVTASHNPHQWNAVKLIKADGSFVSEDGMTEILRWYSEGRFSYAGFDRIGSHNSDIGSYTLHIRLLRLHFDRHRIQPHGFRVLIDSVGGAGSRITPLLLEEFGCEVVPVHTEFTDHFPRGAEPTVRNIAESTRLVPQNHCDIGFCQDPDADRLAVIDETGNAIGEEKTLALAVRRKLMKTKGPVVVNMSTSRMTEDLAQKAHVPFFRSSVGEIHVVDMMKKVKACIGGEGNGGVIDPDVHYGRDSLVAICSILELMAMTEKRPSQLSAELPEYAIVKDKVPLPTEDSYRKLIGRVLDHFRQPDISVDQQDGLRIDFPSEQSWIHLRRSNTEPIMRLIAEAPDEETARHLIERVHELM